MSKNIKKIFLMGGAGNQFFQLARAHSHMALGREVELIKLARLKEVIYRIIGFTYHKDWIDIDSLSAKLGIPSRKVTFNELFILIIYFILRKFKVSNFFDREIFELTEYSLDVGYFQSPKHILPESIDAVAKSISNFLSIKSRPSDLVIHVRGGDFPVDNRISNSHARLIAKYARDNSLEIKIVTNDEKYASELFGFLEHNFIFKGRNAKDDFISLCCAKTLYLSNSTFAFWAAACSISMQSSVVLIPKDFPFRNMLKFNTEACIKEF